MTPLSCRKTRKERGALPLDVAHLIEQAWSKLREPISRMPKTRTSGYREGDYRNRSVSIPDAVKPIHQEIQGSSFLKRHYLLLPLSKSAYLANKLGSA